MSFLCQMLSAQFKFDKNDNCSLEPVLWSCLDFSFIYKNKCENECTESVNVFLKYNHCNALTNKYTY